MSVCISSHGEFSEHTLPKTSRYVCSLCSVFDEDAALARIAELESFVDQVRALLGGVG